MYHFIVNPAAGSGRGSRIWKRLEKQLKKDSQGYCVYFTKKAGDAAEIAGKLTADWAETKILVIVGGEGTYHEVLNGISFKGKITLGYIPAGFRNVFSKGTPLFLKTNRQIRCILSPRRYEIMDYGVLTSGGEEIFSRRFAGRCGIGLDAAICHNLICSRFEKYTRHFHVGKLRKTVLGLKQLVLAKPVKGYIIFDYGKRVEFDHLYFITFRISGCSRGKNQENNDEGKMRVYVANCSKKINMLPILADVIMGVRKKERGVRVYECSEAEIHLNRPLAVHVDGESCLCQQDMTIRCIPKQIRMIGS